MTRKRLIFKRRLFSPDGTPLTLCYYLLSQLSLYGPHTVYGIQVFSYSENTLHPNSHFEEISNFSYSETDTLKLLTLCYHHLVTPTDLYSSVDLLIDQVS